MKETRNWKEKMGDAIQDVAGESEGKGFDREKIWEAAPKLNRTQGSDADGGGSWTEGNCERMWIQVWKLSAQALFIVRLPAVGAVILSVLCSLSRLPPASLSLSLGLYNTTHADRVSGRSA